MKVNVQIKIKMDSGKEVTLNDKEAKELYLKLKELYDQPIQKEYVPYYPYVGPYVYPTTNPYPWTIWYSSDSNITLTRTAKESPML